MKRRHEARKISWSDPGEARARWVAQERLAALGALTAGVAHEIKNPLSFIASFAEVSLELVDEITREVQRLKETPTAERFTLLEESLDDLKSNVERIHQHGLRADSVIRSVLAQARGDAGEVQELDVNELLREHVKLTSYALRAQEPSDEIIFRIDTDDTLGKVRLVPQEIIRVVANLLRNACQAVISKRDELSNDAYAPEIGVTTRDRGATFELRIRDNGLGILPGVEEHIFEPFFTTKGLAEGTGLGLSLCREIVVERNDGDIRFETEEGIYTEFIVILPKTCDRDGSKP